MKVLACKGVYGRAVLAIVQTAVLDWQSEYEVLDTSSI